jgi:hypothetical protein
MSTVVFFVIIWVSSSIALLFIGTDRDPPLIVVEEMKVGAIRIIGPIRPIHSLEITSTPLVMGQQN